MGPHVATAWPVLLNHSSNAIHVPAQVADGFADASSGPGADMVRYGDFLASIKSVASSCSIGAGAAAAAAGGAQECCEAVQAADQVGASATPHSTAALSPQPQPSPMGGSTAAAPAPANTGLHRLGHVAGTTRAEASWATSEAGHGAGQQLGVDSRQACPR